MHATCPERRSQAIHHPLLPKGRGQSSAGPPVRSWKFLMEIVGTAFLSWRFAAPLSRAPCPDSTDYPRSPVHLWARRQCRFIDRRGGVAMRYRADALEHVDARRRVEEQRFQGRRPPLAERASVDQRDVRRAPDAGAAGLDSRRFGARRLGL